ncbi:MAG: hypothetical protein ACFFDT_15490 [Candidatus Hodarchaeota archaeon]
MTLISPIILQDYKIQEDGLFCFFSQPIINLQGMIKTLLAALYEITSKQFYFEIIDDQTAVLKIYGIDGLKFSPHILPKSSVLSRGKKSL